MRSTRSWALLLLIIGISFARGLALRSQAGQAAAQTAAGAWPKDIYTDTGNRLPAVKRESMDDAGRKLFDSRGPTADAFGPGGIRLYSPPVAEHMAAVNDYLRYKSGLDPRLVQLAILVTARETDSEYVWTAHEPQGLKAGLQPEIVDVVKYRKPTWAARSLKSTTPIRRPLPTHAACSAIRESSTTRRSWATMPQRLRC
jgi:alkylhydroperoxidase family enzyme